MPNSRLIRRISAFVPLERTRHGRSTGALGRAVGRVRAPGGACRREPGPPPAVVCAAAIGQASEAAQARPDLLVLAVTHLEGLAVCSGHRPARDGHRLASPGLPSVLVLEVEEPQRSAEDRPGAAGVDPPDVSREPDVGRAADPLRTAPAGLRRSRVDGRQVHGPPLEAALTDLAYFPGQPRRPDRGRRLLHGSNGHVPHPLLLPGVSP